MVITGPQIFYIANVYPEMVGPEEAEIDNGWRALASDDQDYWRAAASVIEKLHKLEAE